MEPKNLYNIMGNYNPVQELEDLAYDMYVKHSQMKEMTLHAPIATTHADKMIVSLYGKEKLQELDAITTNDSELELILYTQLLPKQPIRIDKMDAMINKWEHIIPASAITDQYVNDKRKEITIPIQAFNNKSTLVFYRDNPETGQGILYHYILLQSAKDPNIAQPISLFKGQRTGKLCALLTNEHLRSQEWEIRIEQGEALLAYMDHFTKAWPNIPAMARGPLKINVSKGLYEIATSTSSIDISSITANQLVDLLKGWGG